MSIRKQILIRSYIFFLLAIVLSGAIVWKIGVIQLDKKDSLLKSFNNRYLRIQSIETERGTIFDHNGEVISYSIPKYNVYVDFKTDGLRKRNPTYIKYQLDSLAQCLGQLFPDKTYQELKKSLFDGFEKRQRVVVLLKGISYQEKKKMETFPLINERNKFRTGFIFYPVISRFYPFNNLARRTIGYFRKEDELTLTGLEHSYNSFLKGSKIQIPMRRISGGFYAPYDDDYDIHLERGADVITTLDMHIQDITDHALRKNLMENEAEFGTCIIMDVKTGEIKSWANLGRTKEGDYIENYNYGLTKYTPGSTFKLVSLMALLEEGIMAEDSMPYKGRVKYYDEEMRDHKVLNLKNISLEKAFTESSNVGITEFIVSRFQKRPEKFLNYIHHAHLDTKTGVDLNGEPDPYIKSPETDTTWSGISLPWMSIGYELEITPLSILTLYNSIANNGVMVQPYLVNKIVKDGEVLFQKKKKVLENNVCSKRTLKDIQEMLCKVVTEGTAKSAFRNIQYQVAGKTGTALYTEDGVKGYQKEMYISSFVGYFPADNPQYSCIVVIKNKPNATKHTGSLTSAPVFREISDKILVNNIIVDNQKNYFTTSQKQDKRKYTKKTQEHLVVNAEVKHIPIRVNANNSIPSVKGLSLRDALLALETSGINHVRVDGVGRVVEQQIINNQVHLKLQ